MRVAATVLMWLVTTVALAAAIPALWAQSHLVDGAGYAGLARTAAADSGLQSAMAAELTAQVGRLGSGADPALVSAVAAAYTASSSFPAQFARANGFAHRWLFTDTVSTSVDSQGRLLIDVAPMLSDAAFAQTLRDYGITVPASLLIPVVDNVSENLRPGSLRVAGIWAPWISVGLAVLAAAGALMTFILARRRGRIMAALGAAGLLVGAAGWVAIEIGQRHLVGLLAETPEDLRRIADVMLATARSSMHQWLTVTLIVGGGLVIVGVIVGLLSSLAGAGER
ncbi:MAG: hypothetical protein WD228_05280 [Mycobacterium sp.]